LLALNLFVLFVDRRTPQREPSSPDFRVAAGSFADSQASAKINRVAASGMLAPPLLTFQRTADFHSPRDRRASDRA